MLLDDLWIVFTLSISVQIDFIAGNDDTDFTIIKYEQDNEDIEHFGLFVTERTLSHIQPYYSSQICNAYVNLKSVLVYMTDEQSKRGLSPLARMRSQRETLNFQQLFENRTRGRIRVASLPVHLLLVEVFLQKIIFIFIL